MAEEQPVAARRAGRLALLQEGAERRDAGARADHDDRPVGIGGQAEMRVGLEEHLQPVADPPPCGQVHRGDPGAHAAMRLS